MIFFTTLLHFLFNFALIRYRETSKIFGSLLLCHSEYFSDSDVLDLSLLQVG